MASAEMSAPRRRGIFPIMNVLAWDLRHWHRTRRRKGCPVILRDLEWQVEPLAPEDEEGFPPGCCEAIWPTPETVDYASLALRVGELVLAIAANEPSRHVQNLAIALDRELKQLCSPTGPYLVKKSEANAKRSDNGIHGPRFHQNRREVSR